MRKRTRIWWILLGTVLGFFAITRMDVPAHRPYGVVIVLLDAARADHFGVYGYPRPTTPYIDRLARDAIVMERAYSVACNTRLALASLWTGVHKIESIAKSMPTLPEILHNHGIRTAVLSVNANITPLFGYARGVDHFVYYAWRKRTPSPFRILQDAFNWIQQQTRPFFLYVHLMQPHEPYTPPRAYGVQIGAPVPPRAYSLSNWIYLFHTHQVEPTEAQIRAIRFWYDANLRWADHALGVFLHRLRRAGWLDRIWLVITGDHGEAFGEHGEYYHMVSVYEENIRVPLIVRPPASFRHRAGRYAAYVYMQDLFPTVLRWFRIPVPDWVDFRPLQTVWHDPHATGWSIQISCAPQMRMCALRQGPWKLVVHRPGFRPGSDRLPLVELYRLPDERWFEGNRAPLMPVRVRQMFHLLRQWMWAGRVLRQAHRVLQPLQQLRALGYVAAEHTEDRFRVAPTRLPAEAFRGRVVAYRIRYNMNREHWELAVRIHNESPYIWPSGDTRGRGSVVVDVHIQELSGSTWTGGFAQDVAPGQSGVAVIALPHDATVHPRWTIRDVRLGQRGADTRFSIGGARTVPVGPVVVWSAAWSRFTLDRSDIQWLTGTSGELYLVRPAWMQRQRCFTLRGRILAYHRPRLVRFRLQSDRRAFTVRARSDAWQPVTVPIDFPFGRMWVPLTVETPDGADSPFDVEDALDPRFLSVAVDAPRLVPCASEEKRVGD